MREVHRSTAGSGAVPWTWGLPAGEATTLRAAPGRRGLLVTAGRVWATRTVLSQAGPPPADHWLAAGDTLELPAGSDWVLQAEGDAAIAVIAVIERIEADRATGLSARGAARRWRRAWRSLLPVASRGLQAA